MGTKSLLTQGETVAEGTCGDEINRVEGHF
jgi:hypothetical protein